MRFNRMAHEVGDCLVARAVSFDSANFLYDTYGLRLEAGDFWFVKKIEYHNDDSDWGNRTYHLVHMSGLSAAKIYDYNIDYYFAGHSSRITAYSLGLTDW